MAQVPDIDVSTVSVGGSAYTVPFVYQNRAEVFVEVDGVSTTFTWINDGNISITPAPAAGAVVRRYRSTSALEIRHDYRNGVPFTPKNIAENNDQLLFVVQEATSTAADAEATANGIAATAAAAVATANAADTKAQLALDTIEASGVNSFNTRTGAVMPESGDYDSTQIEHGATTVSGELAALGSALTLLGGSVLGTGQTWQNVTDSRVLNTIYTNTTGKPIYVTVNISQGSLGFGVLVIAGVSVGVAQASSPSEIDAVAGIVQPGETYGYVLLGGAQTIWYWAELR